MSEDSINENLGSESFVERLRLVKEEPVWAANVIEHVIRERDQLRAELKTAREALEFYEDGRTWNYDSEVDKPTVNPWETRAGKDQGKRARAALVKLGKGSQG